MKTLKLSLAVAISTAILSTSAMADSWTITQDIDTDGPSASAEMTQGVTTANNGSSQSLNEINFTNATSTVQDGSYQKVTSNALSAIQAGGDSNTQAVNRMTVNTIGSAGAATVPYQDIKATTLTLDQRAGVGTTGNQQAGNQAKATTVNALKQSLTDGASGNTMDLAMTQAGSKNIQAGNRVSATDINGLEQTIQLDVFGGSPSGATAISQTGDNNIQAGNLLAASNALNITVGKVKQTIVATSSGWKQGANASLQAGNAAILTGTAASATGALQQSITATGGKLELAQDGTANSRQAGNYAGVNTVTTVTP